MWPFNKKQDATTSTSTQSTAVSAGSSGQVLTSTGIFSSGLSTTSGTTSGTYSTVTLPVATAGASAVWTTAGTATISAHISHIPLSKEEQVELDSLKRDWEIEKKNIKLAEFKKVPSELRQFVINALTWQESLKAVNEIVVPQSNRLIELTNKDNAGKYLTGQGIWTAGGVTYSAQSWNIVSINPIPDGITGEELKNAHIEQTLEEEMLNEKS